MSIFSGQPWLKSAVSDGVFILLPPFLALLIVACFPVQFKVTEAMPLEYWIVLVVFIDVAHVYSTLYRTYFNPDKRARQFNLLIAIPIACYITGVLLYHMDGLLFWRVLAYLAVYHFIRQQYGFMRLYSRQEKAGSLVRRIDQIAIYTATIYPILFWHFDGKRRFSWFVEGDFISFASVPLVVLSTWVYAMVIAAYVVKELLLIWRIREINIPRNLLIAGTFLSWYFGIVYFNGDMAFTTLNVVSHGIPYMALVWFFEKEQYKNSSRGNSSILKMTFGKYGVLLFIGVIVLLAYVEEGLWDGLVWKEHAGFFAGFSALPQIQQRDFLTLLVPLLALPQATHYVLDGFIWRRNRG